LPIRVSGNREVKKKGQKVLEEGSGDGGGLRRKDVWGHRENLYS